LSDEDAEIWPPVAHFWKEEPVATASNPSNPRDHLLTQWQQFCARLLPATMLRIARWKGLPAPQVFQGLDDLRQELAVDCLSHADELAGLEPRALRQRWLRLVDRWIYAFAQPRTRQLPPADDPQLPSVPAPALPKVAWDPDLLALSNGRTNVAATARQQGIGVRAVRRQLAARARQKRR
jgi:hypothetical protein